MLSEAEGLVAVRAGLRRISTHPQGPGIIAKTRCARVHTGIPIGQHVVLCRLIAGNRVLQVRAGQGGIAQIKPTGPDRKMRYQEKRLILDTLRELQALLTQFHSRLMFRAG